MSLLPPHLPPLLLPPPQPQLLHPSQVRVLQRCGPLLGQKNAWAGAARGPCRLPLLGARHAAQPTSKFPAGGRHEWSSGCRLQTWLWVGSRDCQDARERAIDNMGLNRACRRITRQVRPPRQRQRSPRLSQRHISWKGGCRNGRPAKHALRLSQLNSVIGPNQIA